MLCREHLLQLQERAEEFHKRDVAIAVVTFDHGPLAEAYVEETGITWPLLLDEERTLYGAYDMAQANNWTLFRPSTVWHYLKLLAKGRRVHRPGSDVHQLGGDVVINPEGIVRLHYISRDASDRPTVAALLAEVDQAASES